MGAPVGDGADDSLPTRAAAVAARVREWFLSDSWSSAAAWLVCALALMAVLAWFFVLSPYGVPATPVYAGF